MIVKYKIILILCLAAIFPYSLKGKDFAINNDFTNESLLDPLFQKLYTLESTHKGKINIVHIGDSHIQGDFFTNIIRQGLQARFGNGGYGFTFPYKLIKTNSNNYITYSSNISWNSQRNIYPITDVSIGLSGIGFYTNQKMFQIDINSTPLYAFDRVKVLYPTQEPMFRLSEYIDENNSLKPLPTKKATAKYVNHKVKSGETLSQVARKYKVTVTDLKKMNGLKSNMIRVGATLKVKKTVVQSEPEIVFDPKIFDKIQFLDPKQIESHPYYSIFTLSELSNKVSIFPEISNKKENYSLSGIVLENNQPGIIYHNIGVNGAKVSDYSKYPLFFEQLPALQADLIIVSFGTNESFGKWSTPYFVSEMESFVSNIRQKNPRAVILLMSPPPSSFRRGVLNNFIEDYGEAMSKMKNCVYWNLLGKLGGANAPTGKELQQFMARDKVHYTKDGYEMQGQLFLNDFMSAYDNYVKKDTIGSDIKSN